VEAVTPNADYGGRYRHHGFGATAALNSTCVCSECGVVVYDTEAHDRWHLGPQGRDAEGSTSRVAPDLLPDEERSGPSALPLPPIGRSGP
jgi:hypothetical protein